MLKKWWVILIQGILMLILGFYIFNNPAEVLTGISLWFGIIVLITGITGLFGWLFSDKEERGGFSFIWSLLTVLFGIFVLTHLLAAMKAITIIFGIWVLIMGFNILISGWSLKNNHFFGWIMLILGIFTSIAGVMMIFDFGSGAEGVSNILGFSVLMAGIGLIILSVSKKMIVGNVQDKIDSFKS